MLKIKECYHFLGFLSLALDLVLTSGAGSGVLSRLPFRLRDEGVFFTGLSSICSSWSWDPFTEPFLAPFRAPFEVAAGNLAAGGVLPVLRTFLAEGSGDRRGGEWLCFRFLLYWLKVLAKYILKPQTLVSYRHGPRYFNIRIIPTFKIRH